MNETEYQYFRELMWQDYKPFKMSKYRLAMYFKFKKLFTEEEINEALRRFDNVLVKVVTFIMSDEDLLS